MTSPDIKIIKFSISSWSHLYSLEQAILHAEQASGKSLNITGIIRNEPLFNSKDTTINIHFNQINNTPPYLREGQHIILGQLRYVDGCLVSTLPVDAHVFEELRKNLMEYADIDGIHIVVTIGLLLKNNNWPQNTDINIVKLDYAMRGDA